MALQLHNSLSRRLEAFEPRESGKVGMYVCGMTVYDYCHIGHARAMVTFDMVYRTLRHKGWEVRYVRNHTDVDDKIIARAAALGEDPLVLSARFIEALDQDLAALGLLPPTEQPKVSENLGGIVAMIQRLVDKGHAYAADNGDVYFAVETFEGYGKLSGKRLDDLRAGERIAVSEDKGHPGDFALWKAARPGEVAWPSPWGPGRPGWHIECSAMSTAALGDSFDIHGGGIDLIFPHHENEIAQSECASGVEPFARYWMHNGHLTLVERQDDGEEAEIKMSKSLGNVIRIRDIVAEVPHEALRLLYLGSHYRSPLPYSTERLAEAVGSLNRIYQAKELAQTIAAGTPHGVEDLVRELGKPAQELLELADGFAGRFEAAMDQDFNTAQAIAHLFDLSKAINRLSNDKRANKRGATLFARTLPAFALCGEVLGISGMEPTAFFDDLKHKRLAAMGLSEESVEALLAARQQARQDKDWARADSLRDELLALNVVVMDNASGVSWRMRV